MYIWLFKALIMKIIIMKVNVHKWLVSDFFFFRKTDVKMTRLVLVHLVFRILTSALLTVFRWRLKASSPRLNPTQASVLLLKVIIVFHDLICLIHLATKKTLSSFHWCAVISIFIFIMILKIWFNVERSYCSNPVL